MYNRIVNHFKVNLQLGVTLLLGVMEADGLLGNAPLAIRRAARGLRRTEAGESCMAAGA